MLVNDVPIIHSLAVNLYRDHMDPYGINCLSFRVDNKPSIQGNHVNHLAAKVMSTISTTPSMVVLSPSIVNSAV